MTAQTMNGELLGSNWNFDYEAKRCDVVVEALCQACVEANDFTPIWYLLLLQAFREVFVLNLADLLTSTRNESHVEDVTPGVSVTSICNDLRDLQAWFHDELFSLAPVGILDVEDRAFDTVAELELDATKCFVVGSGNFDDHATE